MAPPTAPKELISYLSASSTTSAFACDALEEWILYRRSRGDTLFDVSVALIDLEEKTPPHVSSAFDHARYLTSIPDISNLTPPSGVFPLHRSQSPATILAHLLSEPAPSIEHSREVVLEYVLARETKARDKRPGKGGRGTLSREALEEISDRLTEIESGLMTDDGRRLSRNELDEPRTLGMTLLLSLRMSLSYFTLQELSKQLLEVTLGIGERILVQHIRRRLPGEGRWAVGKELEYLESLTLPQRPSLRPAFRSAKARNQLHDQPAYPVALPAPGKSSCIKLIQSYAADSGVSPTSYFSRRGFAGSSSESGSPKSPTTPLPISPTYQPSDPVRLAAYAHEVLTEYVTREKREYMLKMKWAKSGREQLGKDLGEVEQSLCLANKQQPGPLAPTLVPVFLVLRRTYLLPASPLPTKLVDAFIDLLPAPPDPDDIPFREPSVQTATSSLYVNPRLDDAAAFDVLQELIVYEKEILDERGMGDEVPAALAQIIDHVEKRFPDGSYQATFAKAKELALNNGRAPAPIAKQTSMHRRAKSHLEPPPAQINESNSSGPQMPRLRQHSRSTSLPHRRNTVDSLSDSDESIGIELTATHQTAERAPAKPALTTDQPPMLPPLSFASPIEANAVAEPGPTSAGGWWDVVSAVQTQPPSAPWHDNVRSTTRKRTTSGGFSSLPVPPGAEPASIQQAEPLLAQLQTLERVAPTGSISQPVSTHGTPVAPPPTQVPTGAPVSLSQAPQASPASPDIDFSKRQSDAMLSEQLGNLMISPDRSPHAAPSSSSPIPLSISMQNLATPVMSRTHRSESFTPLTGSPAHPTPPKAPVFSAQTTTSVRPPMTSDSDSDDDDDHSATRPVQRQVGYQQPREMLQPIPRPPPNGGTPPAMRPSPTTTPLGTKPKTRGWKSVSAAMGISKDKEKAKEKDKERENNEKVVRTGNRAWPENDPGRWNKNMVANIMGPPADRR